MTTTTHLIEFGTRNPRRNLPLSSARKRGETNFLGSFSRSYATALGKDGLGGKYFEVPGYGIADFVWIHPRKAVDAFSPFVTAFELKLNDWKQAIRQAYAYSYFADRSVVVLPPEVKVAAENVHVFRQLNIGLWFFDPETREIQKIFEPESTKPISSSARRKAEALFRRRLNLRQFFKCPHSLLKVGQVVPV